MGSELGMHVRLFATEGLLFDSLHWISDIQGRGTKQAVDKALV